MNEWMAKIKGGEDKYRETGKLTVEIEVEIEEGIGRGVKDKYIEFEFVSSGTNRENGEI